MFVGRLRVRGRFPLTEQGFQKILEGSPAAQNTRFYRANAAFQHFGDFFVGQALQVTKNYGAAKHLRNLLQGLLYRLLHFVGSELIKGSGAQILDFDRVMSLFRFGVDGHIFFAGGA